MPRKTYRSKTTFLMMLPIVSAILVGAIFVMPSSAQENQLSLADILIALRSKKATMPEKNKILADAVLARGTTFTLTPEIERELANSGADASLIGSLKKRQAEPARIVEVKTAVPSPAIAKPPRAEDLRVRGDELARNGQLDLAVAEYGSALELEPDSISTLFARADANTKLGAPLLAIADHTKIIELDNQNIAAYLARAAAHERNNSPEKALADYTAAKQIDAENKVANESIARLRPAQPQPAAPQPKPVEVAAQPAMAPPTVRPDFVDLGRVRENMYVRMTKPTYPDIALKTRVSGQVTVAVEIDEKGDVVSAKATSGHAFLKEASEFAAKRSKFVPVTFEGQPIRARGVILYTFTQPK